MSRAIVRRDGALTRVRRSTWITTFVAAVLTAVLASVAAASTHTRRAVTHVVHVRRRATPISVPAPPLVAVAAPAAATPPPPAPTPTPAPAVTSSPPVVVSGGS